MKTIQDTLTRNGVSAALAQRVADAVADGSLTKQEVIGIGNLIRADLKLARDPLEHGRLLSAAFKAALLLAFNHRQPSRL